MLSIIKFEILKILKSKKAYILFGITVFIIVALSLAYFGEERKDLYDMPYNIVLQYKSTIDHLEFSEKDENISEELDKLMEKKVYDKTFYIKFNNILMKYLSGTYRGNENMYVDTNYDICLYTIKFNNNLLENKIEPILKNEFVGYNFLLVSLKRFIPLLAIVIPMLLCFDVSSKENDTGSYKFLLLQPNKRKKVILSKVVACSITSICIILIPLLLVFGVVSIINGTGDGDYPMLYDNNSYKTTEPVFKTSGQLSFKVPPAENDYTKDGTFFIGLSEYFNDYDRYVNGAPSKKLELVSIRKLVFTSLPLLVIFIVFISTLSLLISTVTQNSVVSIVIGILICVLGNLSINTVVKSPILSKICPFYYTQSIRILSGTGAQTVLTGIIVLSIYIIAMFFITSLIFRKRDIKC